MQVGSLEIEFFFSIQLSNCFTASCNVLKDKSGSVTYTVPVSSVKKGYKENDEDYDWDGHSKNMFAKVFGHGKSPQIKVKTIDYQVRFTMDLNKQAFQQPFNLSLGKRLSEKMFLKDEFSDVKILCDGKTFPCHKARTTIWMDRKLS